MPRYRVLIHGRNFRLNFDGRWQKTGFYTPRFADAPDALLAAHVALEDFRHSQKYQELVEGSLNGSNDCSELNAEEIEEVRLDAGFDSALPGLAFYNEDEAENGEAGASPNAGSAGAPPPSAS